MIKLVNKCSCKHVDKCREVSPTLINACTWALGQSHFQTSTQFSTMSLCSDKCFNILDHTSTTFQLKIKDWSYSNLMGETYTQSPTLSCWFKTFLVNAYIVLWLLFVLSNQHFVTLFKFNFVLCITQNWRWQKNCRNMLLKSVVHFPRFNFVFKTVGDRCD